MKDELIARRFRLLAISGTILAFVLLAVACSGVTWAIVTQEPDPGRVVGLLLAAGIAAALTIVGGFMSRGHAAALSALHRRYPDGVVFLARRRPTVVEDLSPFLASQGAGPLSESWSPVLVDGRGISTWTSARSPREVALAEWAELGKIEINPFQITGGGHCVTVDVRPYDVPMTVDIGYATGIFTLALSLRETQAAVEATTRRRPVPDLTAPPKPDDGLIYGPS